MKKGFILALSTLVALGTASSLASCTSVDPNAIVFWHCLGQEKARTLQRIVDEYNESLKEKGVKYFVLPQSIAGAYDDLHENVKKKLNAGQSASLTMGYPDSFSEYIGSNGAQKSKILNLDSFINGKNGLTSEEKDDFVDKFYEEGTHYQYEGTWSLPLYKSTEILYYNVDWLTGGNPMGKNYQTTSIGNHPNKTASWGEVWGLPNETWSWQKLTAFATTIQQDYSAHFNGKTGDFHALGYDSDANLIISQMIQRGVPYTEIDERGPEYNFKFFDETKNEAVPGAIDLGVELIELVNSGALVTQGSYGSYASDLFKKKNVVISVGSTGGSSYQEPAGAFTAGLSQVPAYEKDGELQKKYVMQGPSICLFDTKNPDKEAYAWDFYKYISSPNINTQLALQNNYDPVRESCYETEEYEEWVLDGKTSSGEEDLEADLQYRIPEYTKEISNYYFTTPVFVGSSAARENIGDLIRFARSETGATSRDKIKKSYERIFNACQQAVTSK